MDIKKRYEYSSTSKYGGFLPYVIYGKGDVYHRFPYRISADDFYRLNGGTGKCYGKTEWGPWLRLHIFRYIIVGKEPIRDQAILDKLNEKERRFLEDPERLEMMRLIHEQFHGKE